MPKRPSPQTTLLARLTTLSVLAVTTATAAVPPGGGTPEPGLANREDIILFTNFDDPDWREQWGARESPRAVTVTEDAAHGFVPHSGQALRITVEKGKHYGTSMAFRFKQRLGEEPEELYFRYYLRLANTWRPERGHGGKLPGIGGTYDRAGWGGRVANGRNGWSARGLFKSPQDGGMKIGFYCYHTGMGRWGSEWTWNHEDRGLLENDRWYCIEQHVRLNTPAPDGRGEGAKDGVLRGWVDGELAFEKLDVSFRHVADLKIDRVWIDIYYGGEATPPHDMHLFIDNVVVASNYIGPVDKPKKKEPRVERPTAAPTPTPPTQTDDATLASYRLQLRERLMVALAAKRRPRFVLSVVQAEVEVQGMDGNQVQLLIPGSGTRMSYDLLSMLSLTDAAELALALLRRGGEAEDHAVAAFFLIATGKQAQAETHLFQAGELAPAVRAAFGDAPAPEPED